MLIIVDPNDDGIIDNAMIMYPAPRGGMDHLDLAVRKAFITTLIGEKNAESNEVIKASMTTVIRNKGLTAAKIDGFIVGGKSMEDADNTQMVAIVNESNHHPDKSRSEKDHRVKHPGIDYFG